MEIKLIFRKFVTLNQLQFPLENPRDKPNVFLAGLISALEKKFQQKKATKIDVNVILELPF
ncbi:MAG: hypothetical protein OCC45_13800 [Desulfotalea sp.]